MLYPAQPNLLAGEFQMGRDDPEARADEQPVCPVYVDAFYMDETEALMSNIRNLSLKIQIGKRENFISDSTTVFIRIFGWVFRTP